MSSRFFLLVYVVICLYGFSGCQSKEREMKRLIKNWQHRTIVFPEYMETKVQGHDTGIADLLLSRYKILNYIDSSDCTSCQAQLEEWNLLQKKTDSLRLDVDFLFIVHVKEYEEWETLQQIHGSKIPCIYDRNNEIGRANSFPTQPGFQTFLLDSANQVLFIGNPVRNEQIEQLYLETIKSKSDK